MVRIDNERSSSTPVIFRAFWYFIALCVVCLCLVAILPTGTASIAPFVIVSYTFAGIFIALGGSYYLIIRQRTRPSR